MVTLLSDDFEYDVPIVSKLAEQEKEHSRLIANITNEELEEKLNEHLIGKASFMEEIPGFINTVRKAQEACLKHNYDPLESLINVATDEQMNALVKIGVHKEIMKYTYAKAKPQEVNQTKEIEDGSRPITVNIVKYGNQ